MITDAMQVLRDAVDLLFRRGWTQGSYRNEDGYCAEGALLAAAVGRQEAANPARYYLLGALQQMDPANIYGVISWNDTHGRTFDEVIEAFEKAQKLAEIDAAQE